MFLGAFITYEEVQFYTVTQEPDGSGIITPAKPNIWFDEYFASFGLNIALIVISLISSINFCCVRHYLYKRHEEENLGF